MSRILIVEDEDIIRNALKKVLVRQQYDVAEAGSVEEAIPLLPTGFDLIISDLRLPGEPGTYLLEHCNSTPVIIMTSYASMRSAVDAMKLGAVDYIANLGGGAVAVGGGRRDGAREHGDLRGATRRAQGAA